MARVLTPRKSTVSEVGTIRVLCNVQHLVRTELSVFVETESLTNESPRRSDRKAVSTPVNRGRPEPCHEV